MKNVPKLGLNRLNQIIESGGVLFKGVIGSPFQCRVKVVIFDPILIFGLRMNFSRATCR